MEDWMEAAIKAASAEQAMPMTVVPDRVPGRVLNLDGDYLAYFMAGNDDTDIGTARRNSIQRILNMMEMTGSTKCVMNLTATGSTKADRWLIATTRPYQAQRSGARPKNWPGLRAFFEGYQGDVFKPRLWWDREADDGMSMLQAYQVGRGQQELIVTGTRDKDMRQYPGWHMDWTSYLMTWVPPGAFAVTGEDGKLYGHKWFWQQVLMGDGVDNIPGLERYIKDNGKIDKMGEKRAEAALAKAENDQQAFDVVAKLYEGYYKELWPVRLLEQMELLWLRRGTDPGVGDWINHLQIDASWAKTPLMMLRQRIANCKDEVAALCRS